LRLSFLAEEASLRVAVEGILTPKALPVLGSLKLLLHD